MNKSDRRVYRCGPLAILAFGSLAGAVLVPAVAAAQQPPFDIKVVVVSGRD